MRIPRCAAVALAAAAALTPLDLTPALAANPTGRTQATKPSTIDLSARRRRHHGHTVAFGTLAILFDTIAAIAAANRYRERYDCSYDKPYYRPYGYYAAPYGYGRPYVYSQSYRLQRWHRRARHH